MPLTVLVSALASTLLLPPVNALLLCLLGWGLHRRWRRLGKLCIALGVALLLLLSTRAGALLLASPLESLNAPLRAPNEAHAQAIVILGAGRLPAAPEYDGRDQLSLYGLKRVEYGAWLHKQTGLPILVSGGSPDNSPEGEAVLMARTLAQDFGVSARWLEDKSNTTWENAQLSAPMLKAAGISRVLVVTDAVHMPRAMASFARAGLDPVAAPTLFNSSARHSAFDYLPNSGNLMLASYAMREWIGRLWYLLRG